MGKIKDYGLQGIYMQTYIYIEFWLQEVLGAKALNGGSSSSQTVCLIELARKSLIRALHTAENEGPPIC